MRKETRQDYVKYVIIGHHNSADEITDMDIEDEAKKRYTTNMGIEDGRRISAFVKGAKAYRDGRIKRSNQRKCPNCGRMHDETAYNVFCCDACWNGY